MPTEGTLSRLFWDQSIFICVTFNIVLDLVIILKEPMFLGRRVLFKHLANVCGMPESRIFH